MHATAEQLLDIVGDLCAFGSMLLAGGYRDRADVLLDQAADLLSHRADVLMLARTTGQNGRSLVGTATGVSRWTN